MKPAIQLNHIFKQFVFKQPTTEPTRTVIKAVKNVSLTVAAGEWLGIIGPNGSGKTTLAKIMAGIITPTTGTVTRYGSIVPVLGLGAGFHGELTAAENVRLSGMLFGLSRSEISEQYPRIIEFAGLEKFSGLPLKYYSSGMRMRLALGVATHVQADILILDEVFAVGDAAFRQKSMRRLEMLHQQATTIVLISHNTGQLERVCSRVAYINKGQLVAIGDPKTTIAAYTATL